MMRLAAAKSVPSVRSLIASNYIRLREDIIERRSLTMLLSLSCGALLPQLFGKLLF